MNQTEQPLICLAEVDWLEMGAGPTTDLYGPCNLTCPATGELRFVSVKKNVGLSEEPVEAGQKRWLLFAPNNASINGFDQDSNPGEVDMCAVIEVEILSVAPHYHRFDRRGRDRVWLECRCLQVVPVAQIPDVFPPIFGGKRASDLLATMGRTATYFFKSHPVLVEWYMVTNPKTTRRALPHLVLSCTSDDGYCFIVNCVVECDNTSWKAS
ncbi:hypothetical protein IAD21_01005 [Abditibacteriota bacterium]|nr:hypothetical protein IAD21_01005 [Abditibacteriota bacterium]